MALMDFIKKQFIDILQWTESGDGTLAWRFPMQEMEIQNGASLTVRDSQVALFVNEGTVADVFAPGMYKLTTQTLPVLTYLKNWDKLFESPFKSDVYFFSTRQQIDQRWGTQQPVTIRDKDFDMIRVRAFDVATFVAHGAAPDLPAAVREVIAQGAAELAEDAAAERKLKAAEELAAKRERAKFRDAIRDFLQANAGLPSTMSTYIVTPSHAHSGNHRVRFDFPGCQPVYIDVVYTSCGTVEFGPCGSKWEATPAGATLGVRYPTFARAVAAARHAKLNEVPL